MKTTKIDFKNRKYFNLKIIALRSKTDIWLSDDKGFFVQKETGVMDTSLIPGKYFVEFGESRIKHPIKLDRNLVYKEKSKK